MSWNPYPPLPVGALKDLLGITRALYREASEQEPKDANRLATLGGIGQDLRAALRGARATPGTIEHGTAWGAAERATGALRAAVAGEGRLSVIVEATARRATRAAGSMV